LSPITTTKTSRPPTPSATFKSDSIVFTTCWFNGPGHHLMTWPGKVSPQLSFLLSFSHFFQVVTGCNERSSRKFKRSKTVVSSRSLLNLYDASLFHCQGKWPHLLKELVNSTTTQRHHHFSQHTRLGMLPLQHHVWSSN
jgi:hypothetical protein